MRPTPSILAGAIATLLAAAPAYAAPAAKTFGAGTATSGTTTTGTTASTSSSSTGTTTASAATSGGATPGTPSRLQPGLYPTSPAAVIGTNPTSNNSLANAAGGTAINSTTTTFNNGARYVVNADGTVTLLSNVASTTGTTATTGTTGNTLAAAVNGTGTAAGATTTTNPNPLAQDVLGTSPGQSTLGAAAGNSSAGIVDSGAVLSALNAANTGTFGTPNAFAPGVVVGGIATSPYLGGADYAAMADAGGGVNANGERVASIGGMGSGTGGTLATTARTPTPTYDMVTRAAAARDLNRRAKGQAPRIYGIAPRTNNDRTDQMPDDPIIRY